MNEDLNMDSFLSLDEDDLNLEDFKNLDEEETSEDVVGDQTDEDGTPSDEDDPKEDPSEDGNEGNDSDDEDKKISQNLYSSLAKVLYEEGVATHLDLEKDKIQSAEDLVAIIQREVNAREFSDLSDTQKQYLEALRSGVPEESVKESFQIDAMLDSITEDALVEDEDLRLDINKQYYIARGFDDAEATKYAKRSLDMGEDLEDARTNLEALRQLNSTRRNEQIRLAAEKRENYIKEGKETLSKLKESVNNIQDLIPEANLDPKTKDSLFRLITSPAGEAQGQQVNAVFKYINENPVEANIKIAYLFQATDGFKDFTKLITKKAKSKASKELETFLQSTKDQQFLGGIEETNNDDYFGSKDYDIIL